MGKVFRSFSLDPIVVEVGGSENFPQESQPRQLQGSFRVEPRGRELANRPVRLFLETVGMCTGPGARRGRQKSMGRREI